MLHVLQSFQLAYGITKQGLTEKCMRENKVEMHGRNKIDNSLNIIWIFFFEWFLRKIENLKFLRNEETFMANEHHSTADL